MIMKYPNVNYKRLIKTIDADEKYHVKIPYGSTSIMFLYDMLDKFHIVGFTDIEIDEYRVYHNDYDDKGNLFIRFIPQNLIPETDEEYNIRIAKEEKVEIDKLEKIKNDKLRKQKTIDEKIQLEKNHLEKLAAKYGAKIIYESNNE